MGNIHTVSHKAAELAAQIDPQISAAGYYIKNNTSMTYSFMVSWPNSPYIINIAYPPHLNETAYISGYIIEVSIGYGPCNILTYINEAGYKSAQHFTTPAEVITEIKRFSKFVSSPSFSCADHPSYQPAPSIRSVDNVLISQVSAATNTTTIEGESVSKYPGSYVFPPKQYNNTSCEHNQNYYDIDPWLIPIEYRHMLYQNDFGYEIINMPEISNQYLYDD